MVEALHSLGSGDWNDFVSCGSLWNGSGHGSEIADLSFASERRRGLASASNLIGWPVTFLFLGMGLLLWLEEREERSRFFLRHGIRPVIATSSCCSSFSDHSSRVFADLMMAGLVRRRHEQPGFGAQRVGRLHDRPTSFEAMEIGPTWSDRRWLLRIRDATGQVDHSRLDRSRLTGLRHPVRLLAECQRRDAA